jgi:TP901 family phage tail tape measure protein
MPKNIILKISQKGAAKTGKALKNVTSSIVSLGAKSALVGAGFAVLSVKLAGDFQKSLLEVTTLMTKTNEHTLPAMSRELRSVAASSGLALSSISKAKYDIISAGFSSAAESAKILATASKLAVGGVTSAASAADLLTTALNAYGKTSDEVNNVADILFTTVRLGKTTMDELASSLGMTLPFAKTMGLSLADVGAAMATLTASGIKTAEATTSLKASIIALSAPTDSARNAMQAAGIEVIKFKDGSVDLVSTIAQFEGMDQKSIQKFIPSIEAIAGIQVLANNFDVLRANVRAFETESAGATEIAFEKMATAFNTQMSMIKNSMQGIMIEIGDIIIDEIQPAITAANAELQKLGNIGWDKIGATLKDNSSAVFNLMSMTFDIAARRIEDSAKLMGMKIKNELASIIPFSKDNSKAIAAFSSHMEVQAALDADALAQSWKVTYQFIVDQAQQRADAELEIMETARIAREELDAEEAERRKEKEDAEKTGAEDVVVAKIDGLTRHAHAAKMAGIQAKNQSEEMIAQGLSVAEAEKFISQQRVQFEANVLAAKLGTTSGVFSALSDLNAASKGSALVSKRLAQGSALIDTYAGANKALASGPPPWNLLAAAAVVAAGLANVAKIESTEFAQGGIVPGSGTRDTVPAMLTPGEVILNQSQQSNLVSGMGGITINVGKFIGSQENADELANIIEERARLGFNRIAVS